MTPAEQKLDTIAGQLRKGLVPPRETVRSLLLWFGASRRGLHVSSNIRAKLETFQLRTEPDFESAYIDSEIAFQLKVENAPANDPATDPTHRVIRLASANRPPLSVTPESTLKQIITLMLSNDYSQLPVMTSPRELKGVVSWKTIGSRLRRSGCATPGLR
jgi:hypothetical protein